jgi:hypothetical protein
VKAPKILQSRVQNSVVEYAHVPSFLLFLRYVLCGKALYELMLRTRSLSVCRNQSVRQKYYRVKKNSCLRFRTTVEKHFTNLGH